MNKMTLNSASMYDEVAEINQLNRVEGFDPRKYMRLIQTQGQPGRYYLDVAYRKLWFRLRYPEGKVVRKLIRLTEQVAIVEARVYLNRNDPEDGFISNAFAQKYQSDDDRFGNKYVELAETAAVGRALSDAGFGLQFADKEGDFDPDVTEAPIDSRIMNGGSMITEGADMDGEILEAGGEALIDDAIPGQHGIEEYIPMPGGVENAMEQGIVPAMQQNGGIAGAGTPAMRQTAGQNPQESGKAAGSIRKDMPVEEIYRLLNRDTAAAVVVPMGFNRGKTLGQVAVEKPNSLEWYVTSYGGPDNLLRAAAQFLMDTALAKAG